MNISQVNQEQLIFTGATRDLNMPGGFKITIREINGDDEDKLSKLKDSKDGSAMHKFLAQIIVGNNVVERKITEEDIVSWKIRDKYYALYWAVRHTHGDKTTFRWTFANGNEVGFEEDLTKFDWDFKKGAPPKLGQKDYNKDTIQPYPEGKDFVEGTTSSKKNYRFKYLTGTAELSSLGKSGDELSINEKLRIREFELQLPTGTWLKLDNFASLSAKDTKEIRRTLETEDPDFTLNVEVRDPSTGAKELVSLFGVPDFFFPIV